MYTLAEFDQDLLMKNKTTTTRMQDLFLSKKGKIVQKSNGLTQKEQSISTKKYLKPKKKEQKKNKKRKVESVVTDFFFIFLDGASHFPTQRMLKLD